VAVAATLLTGSRKLVWVDPLTLGALVKIKLGGLG
jgi:hypothetical protein